MATLETPSLIDTRPSLLARWSAASTRAVQGFEENPGRVLFGISLLYFTLVIPLALIKLLWADEFITFYIAKLNSVRAIWDALSLGADPNPPGSHLLVMWSMRLFGDSALAVRLPAILASFLGVVCLLLFLKKRVPVIYAAAGACFFMSTAAFNYSYESRSYALTLGFAMLSLVMWRASVEGKHPYWSAAGLALALGAGLSSNYFTALAFFPIAAGELVRTLDRRKIDFRIWFALAVGSLPMLAYMPLINHAIAIFGPHAWNKPTPDFLSDSYTEMVEVILWPALAIMAASVITWIYQRKTRGYARPGALPRHEMVAVVVNMAYPFIGYAIALARAGMISPRFVIPMCYGFAIAAVVAWYRMFSRHSLAAVFLLLLCFSWAITRDGVCAYDYLGQRNAFNHVHDSLPQTNTIAVSDSLLVLPLYHYSSPQVASRIVFPLDFKAIHKYKHEDSLEQNLWAGRQLFPVPIVSLQQLENDMKNYLIVTTQGNWLLQQLDADGDPATTLPIYPDTRDIRGFTPLCHGDVFMFEMGDALGTGEEYAANTAGRVKTSSTFGHVRDSKRAGPSGMTQ